MPFTSMMVDSICLMPSSLSCIIASLNSLSFSTCSKFSLYTFVGSSWEEVRKEITSLMLPINFAFHPLHHTYTTVNDKSGGDKDIRLEVVTFGLLVAILSP